LSGARVERRLAAILAADDAGCSRLMGEDDAGTLARLAGVAHAICDISDELVASAIVVTPRGWASKST
jgi:hypothetical protein